MRYYHFTNQQHNELPETAACEGIDLQESDGLLLHHYDDGFLHPRQPATDSSALGHSLGEIGSSYHKEQNALAQAGFTSIFHPQSTIEIGSTYHKQHNALAQAGYTSPLQPQPTTEIQDQGKPFRPLGSLPVRRRDYFCMNNNRIFPAASAPQSSEVASTQILQPFRSSGGIWFESSEALIQRLGERHASNPEHWGSLNLGMRDEIFQPFFLGDQSHRNYKGAFAGTEGLQTTSWPDITNDESTAPVAVTVNLIHSSVPAKKGAPWTNEEDNALKDLLIIHDRPQRGVDWNSLYIDFKLKFPGTERTKHSLHAVDYRHRMKLGLTKRGGLVNGGAKIRLIKQGLAISRKQEKTQAAARKATKVLSGSDGIR